MKSLVLLGLLIGRIVTSGVAQPTTDPTPTDPNPTDEVPATAPKESLFERLDRNKDGAVQLSELPPELQSRLKPLFDRLGKTQITEEELRSVSDRPATGGTGSGREAYFATLDANGDGRLSVEEVPEAAKALVAALLDRVGKKRTDALTKDEYVRLVKMGGGSANDSPKPAGPGLMQTLDVNRDGKLTRQELAAAVAKFDLLDADESGDLDARELLGAADTEAVTDDGENDRLVERIFDDLDTDDDGFVDVKEARAEGVERLAENFERIDTSEDGRIDLAEFKKSIAAPPTDTEPRDE